MEGLIFGILRYFSIPESVSCAVFFQCAVHYFTPRRSSLLEKNCAISFQMMKMCFNFGALPAPSTPTHLALCSIFYREPVSDEFQFYSYFSY